MGTVLCKGGRVWDGTRFFRADVLTEGAQVKRIAENISEKADFVADVTGMTLTAGLVDGHVHFRGISSNAYGTQAEMCTLPFGVTAAADASGVQGDQRLLESLGVQCCTFVCADIRENHADFTKAEEMLRRFGAKAVGVKIYFDAEMSPVRDAAALRETAAFARERGLRVMVHSSHSPVPMAELLDCLAQGDILTHAFHGGPHSAAEDGFACIREAKQRGVFIDAGLAGHVHTDFTVMEQAIRTGAAPDILSSDVTRLSTCKRGGRYGLPMCMSIARYLGMAEEDVFRAVTSTPAKALGQSWGTLKEGGTADLAVLAWGQEPFDLTDGAGRRIQSAEGYRNVLTIAGGEVVYRE